MEGKVETKTIESKSDDEYADLADELLGEKVDRMSLMDMYKQTFKEPDPLGDFQWDQNALVDNLVYGVKEASRQLIAQLGRSATDKMKVDMYNYLRILRREKNQGSLNVRGKLEALIEEGYQNSTLSADDFKKQLSDYRKFAVQLLVSRFGERSGSKMVVDMQKKARLKRILQMAIKIGLNYQMLSVFDKKFLPEKYDLDDDDYDTYFPDRIVPEGFKKIKMSDLAESPYWEGIRVVPDMGEYVSVESLDNFQTDQLVNMVKRVTLYKMYKVNKDYRLNLDTASPSDFKTLCTLNTLELAPDVHADACRHFERGTGRMEDKYRVWLRSNRSFKPYRKVVEDKTKFITVPYVPYAAETSVSEVINDLSLLPGLIRYRNHDDHENEIVKNGNIVLSSAPSDAEFAVELSNAFVELGFLPEGYERYCGVKTGVARAKRSADGTVSPAKRPREKLFTAVETY